MNEPEYPWPVGDGAEHGAVGFRGFAWMLVVGLLAYVSATTVSAGAEPPASCDSARAWTFFGAAERAAEQHRYSEAATLYVAATRAASECRTPNESIMRANSLFGAGTAFALSGDALRGLNLLHAAQAQVNALIDAGDRETVPRARAILDLIGSVISEINTIAKGSM
jgi:hypothetical protein